MPCSERKARILLKEGKARLFQRHPFTIQRLYPTGENVQPVSIGVDTGAAHIGIAVVSEDNVLNKTQIDLRTDVHSKITARKICRRSRRNRKTRYRKARFLNRTGSKKGMAAAFYPKPYHSICAWTDRFVRVLPDPELHIEAAKFDVQKIMNPDLQKEDYPHGPAYGFWNNRYFVFARDEYNCQICGKKKDANGSEILHTHHRVFESQGGSDRPDNLHSICAWTDRFVRVLPDPELHIEAAKFDVQKIMNPDIQKEDYPHGPAYGFWNNRYFVFARDEYNCQICGKKKDANGSEILHTHHRVFESQGGSDRPDNLAAVHAFCHERFQ